LIKRTQRRGADFNSTQETFVEGVECNQPQLGLRCVTAGAVLMKPYGGARRL
jgi:ribosomal protein S27E